MLSVPEKWRVYDKEIMAGVPVSSLEEDEARREEWRAAHLLLSAPVPDNLTRLLRGKTVRIFPAAVRSERIVFVGARYKHVRCTNSKLRALYTRLSPAK